MNGIIIQQISLKELESLVRNAVREEIQSSIPLSNTLKPPGIQDETLLSKSEAAKVLRISLPTFAKMVKDGQVKPYKVGRRFKFKKNQILSSINTK